MTTSVSDSPKFQWKEPVVPKEGEGKTSVTATFTYSGKKYEMTVSYDKKGLQSSYGIEENKIDNRIKALVNKLDLKDLSSLSGVKIKASLTDFQQSVISRTSDGVSDTIENLQGQDKYSEMCATVSKVIAVFSQLKSKPKDEEEEEKKQDHVELKVEHEQSPTSKKPLPFTFEFEEVDESPELSPKKKDSDEDKQTVDEDQND